ncbi:hypothetical protein [Paraferrimonas haliotis]|uniref:Uncharacterized protein n=1 Tax=Paraferrimonas haliotis TaxID=2013866 RepID=A0AA37TPE6_9GAMM|nr:hypothetical protein [Paraferrimonas haliotis]GLS83213.1 hypothetical protein GCM10007894_11900 [Paraferrimonas haliotis]
MPIQGVKVGGSNFESIGPIQGVKTGGSALESIGKVFAYKDTADVISSEYQPPSDMQGLRWHYVYGDALAGSTDSIAATDINVADNVDLEAQIRIFRLITAADTLGSSSIHIRGLSTGLPSPGSWLAAGNWLTPSAIDTGQMYYRVVKISGSTVYNSAGNVATLNVWRLGATATGSIVDNTYAVKRARSPVNSEEKATLRIDIAYLPDGLTLSTSNLVFLKSIDATLQAGGIL